MSSEHSRSSAPSEADPFGAALDAAVRLVLGALAEVRAAHPLVLIDGRSGAGKSTLARALAAAWPAPDAVQLVALDSIYPGWDGLVEGAEIAHRGILAPHAAGRVGTWRRHDWDAGAPAEAHAVDPALPLIVEGCGILTAEARALCDMAVWVDAPEPSRRSRAIARDGESYRPHWERWAAQELRHIATHDPVAHASLVVRMP